MAVKFGSDGTLYCNTVKYNYKQLRNLVADGTNAILGGTGAWSSPHNANVNFNSLAGTFVFGTGYCMLMQQMPEPIKGHKYYGAVKMNAQNGFSCGDGRFEWQINDNYSLTFAQHAHSSGTGGRYVISSGIKDINDYPSGQSWNLRLFTVGANIQSTYKNIIVVDLTDAFGAGNEPTKEWCDVHILEHNLLNNVGDHLSPIPTTSDYNIGSSYNISAASYGAWNYHQLASDVTMPKDVVYFMQGNSSRSECTMSSIKSYYLSPSLNEYAQVFLLLDEAAPSKGADLDFYHPVSEPSLGRTAVGQNSLFCAGGAASRWKKYSATNSRASFSVGNYPLRFDLNNRKTDAWCYITSLFLTTVSSQVTWYNYNINTGTDINVAAVNKEWCERWVGGPFNSIIHIKDPHNTKIKFNTAYDIVCNDIEIRPEQNKIVFDKTGTIICKKLVRTLTY